MQEGAAAATPARPAASTTSSRRAAAAAAAPTPTKSGPSKGLFAVIGAGGVAAAAAIAVIVFMLGGSDTPVATKVEAKGLLSPTQFDSSSQDLASTIAALNKAQIKLAQDLAAPVPPEPKLVEDGLKEVAAQSMRAAELANVLSETNQSQDNGSDTPTQGSENYDAIARLAYSQVLEMQNLREQYLQGLADLQQMQQLVADYGARLWNSGVVLDGITGNPFIPWLTGVPGIDVAIALNPTGVATFTGQLTGGNVSIWIANSAAVTTRTVTIDLSPTISTFNPYDQATIIELLTANGQTDAAIVRQVVLARLDRFRFGGNRSFVNVVGFDGVPVIGGSVLTDFRGAPLYSFPNGGRITLGLGLANGLAIAGVDQFRGGFLPTFNDGRASVIVTRTGPVPVEQFVYRFSPGGTIALVGRVAIAQPQGIISVDTGNFRVRELSLATDPTYGRIRVLEIFFDISWSSNVVPFTISCGNLASFEVSEPFGVRTLRIQDWRVQGGVLPILNCYGLRESRVFSYAIRTVPFVDEIEVRNRDTEQRQVLTLRIANLDRAREQTFVNVVTERDLRIAEMQAAGQQAALDAAAAAQAQAEAEAKAAADAAAAARAQAPAPRPAAPAPAPAAQAPAPAAPPAPAAQAPAPAAPPPAAAAPVATPTRTPTPRPQTIIIIQPTPSSHGSAPAPPTGHNAAPAPKQTFPNRTMNYNTLAVSWTGDFSASKQFQVCITQGTPAMNNHNTVVPPTIFNNQASHFQGLVSADGSINFPSVGVGTHCDVFRGGGGSTATITCGHFTASGGSFTFSLREV